MKHELLDERHIFHARIMGCLYYMMMNKYTETDIIEKSMTIMFGQTGPELKIFRSAAHRFFKGMRDATFT